MEKEKEKTDFFGGYLMKILKKVMKKSKKILKYDIFIKNLLYFSLVLNWQNKKQ